MNAFSYYHDPSDVSHRYPEELIGKWKESFEKHGFTPRLLTEKNARNNPKFEEISALVKTFPTVNDRVYEHACWMRWLAYELEAPALFTDWDVINFGLTPEMVPKGNFISLNQFGGPGAVYATPSGVGDFIDRFEHAGSYVVGTGDREHVSDMILCIHFSKSTLPSLEADVTRPGAMTVPLVHFPNYAVKPEYRFASRYLAVDEFYKLRNSDEK